MDGRFFPALHVVDPGNDETDFLGESLVPIELDGFSDPEITFSWSASAREYAGLVSAFRYVFDANDPLNVDESEWDTPWADLKSATANLAPGPHNFVIAVRDNSEVITRGVYILSVN